MSKYFERPVLISFTSLQLEWLTHYAQQQARSRSSLVRELVEKARREGSPMNVVPRASNGQQTP